MLYSTPAVRKYETSSTLTQLLDTPFGDILSDISGGFNIENSPLCECGSGAIETVDHYLLLCGWYDKERATLIEEVGVGGMWIERLLGNPKLIGYALEFLESTKRMKF